MANPALPDPNFHRTVVLMLEHNDDGAVGVVLNRPSDTHVGEALPALAEVASEPAVVHVGGPVAPTAALCLARMRQTDEAEGVAHLFGALGSIDLDQDLDLLVPSVEGVRVFAGYSGWAAGQLEGEIDAGAWFVVGMESDDPFSARSSQLWRDVLRRQPPSLAMLASFPEDVTTN